MRTVIGIDPGKKGAIVLYSRDGAGKVEPHRMPTRMNGKKVEIDLYGIDKIINPALAISECFAFIEDVHAMPGQGVTSMFSFGFSTGAMHGILSYCNIPIYKVTPQSWKRVILKGLGTDKAAAIEYCHQHYPQISLIPTGCRVPSDGLADGLCIAEYGWKKLTGLI
jgi:crossover junction endodeoxyribonuclease RuvC